MEFAKIVMFILPLLIVLSEVSTNKPDILIHRQEMLKKITKRQADNSQSHRKLSEFNVFVENKLVEHSQALEHILKLVNEAIKAINALADKITSDDEEPKFLEKGTRRMGMKEKNGNVEEVYEHPIVRFGKDLEKYGVFYKDIIMKALQNHVEPVPLVARKY